MTEPVDFEAAAGLEERNQAAETTRSRPSRLAR
jgi:hypothetical protein